MSTLLKVLTAFAIGVAVTIYVLKYVPRDWDMPVVPASSDPPTVLKADQQLLSQLDAVCDAYLRGDWLTVCVPGNACPDPIPEARAQYDRSQRIANTVRSAAEILRLSGQACLNRPDTEATFMLSYVCNSRRERSPAQKADPMLFIVDTLKRVYAPEPDGHCLPEEERRDPKPPTR